MRYLELQAKRFSWFYSLWLILIIFVPKILIKFFSVESIEPFMITMGVILIAITLIFGILTKGHSRYLGEFMNIVFKQPILIATVIAVVIASGIVYGS